MEWATESIIRVEQLCTDLSAEIIELFSEWCCADSIFWLKKTDHIADEYMYFKKGGFMFLKALFSAILITGVCYSAGAKASDDGWLLVPNSDRNDFKIICSEGKKFIWGVFPRNGTSDYQVARNIYIGHTSDGRTVLSFMRGFINADKQTTYFPAPNVSCEITEK